MKCPEINGLSFDHSSNIAIDEIRQKHKLGNMLTIALGGSALVNIFVGMRGIESPLSISWNISQFEWNAWSHAMMSIESITRNRIRLISAEQALTHSGKQREFWEAVADGCGN